MKAIGRAILSAIFLILTGLMAAAAKYAPDFVFSFYPGWSRKVLAALWSVAKVLPIALWEVLALLGLLWALYTFVCIFTKRRGFFNWLAGVVLALCAGVFLFTALWGLNHFAPGIDQTLGLDVREYSREELVAATKYYAAEASEYASQVTRDEAGLARFSDFSTLSAEAGAGYAALRETYPQFDGAVDGVKSLASWRLFSQFGTTGIFICFTGESCVNPDTYETWIPFTMCHEIAHRQAVAAEDEANFCAYLACMENGSAEFRYSGAFAAYIYCNNALARVDREAAGAIWQTVADGVKADSAAANAHYAQYEGKVQDAAQKVNNVYLKAFNEESGVQSYGEVADLLIAHYLTKIG